MKKFTLSSSKDIQSSFKIILKEALPNKNEEFLFEVYTAASEALQNIVRHTYHFKDNQEVRCWFESDDQYFRLFIEDDGPPLEDLSFLDMERLPSEKGNMGLNIIKKLTESFSIEPKKNGNLTTLIFKLKI